MLRALLDDLRRHDSLFWRRAIDFGVSHGPDAWVRYSPPVFGVAFAAALPRHRRAVRQNLRRALGPRSAAREVLDVARVFASYASCLTETFIAGTDGGRRLIGRCINDQNYMAAEAEGKGVILATAHIGGWQVAGSVLLAAHPADVLVVMRRERDQRAQELQDAVRRRTGVRIVHVGDDPLDALPIVAHLRNKGVVAVQVDRVPAGMRGRTADLFGAPFSVPEGPLRLSAVSGAPLVPVFTRRVGFMEYEVHIAAPIHLSRRPSEAELDAAAQRVLREMESFVRANPTQWFHFE